MRNIAGQQEWLYLSLPSAGPGVLAASMSLIANVIFTVIILALAVVGVDYIRHKDDESVSSDTHQTRTISHFR